MIRRYVPMMLACLLVAAPFDLSSAAENDLRQLTAERDRLLAALEKKPAVEQLLLRFDEGADHDDMTLTLRRSGGKWQTGFADVLGWQQSTMQEWRGYYLANTVAGCWRPNLRFPATTDALQLDATKLTGSMNVAYKLDELLIQRQPPGVVVSWWDKFIPGGHTIPRQQSYAIDAAVHPDGCLLEVVLEGGLYWDPKFAEIKNPKASTEIVRRPITVRLQVPSTRFTYAHAVTPTWNGGFHEADPSGLKFEKGKITGTLVVFIHQDGWMPWAAGKHIQHEPIVVKFDLDAQLANNELTGTYKAMFGGALKGVNYVHRDKSVNPNVESVLPDTSYEGSVTGRGGKLVVGRYKASGELGEQVGAIDGMLLDNYRPVREQIKSDGTDINALLHQIRALNLALQHAPLPYTEAWRQTDWPAPAEPPSPSQAAAYIKVQPINATPKTETVGDSPSLGCKPLAVEENVNVFAPNPDGWYFLPQWHVLGTFEQRFGVEHDTALVPDIVPILGATYVQPRDRYGAERQKPIEQTWKPVTCKSPRLGAPWESTGFFAKYYGNVWYGVAMLKSASSRKVWLSLEANDFAKLWVNGQLVWADIERPWRYRSYGRVFVPVELKAGDNQLLTRVHNDRQLGWLRLAVTAKEPATPAMPSASPAYDNPNIFPDAQPPLAWDIQQGINVAWRDAKLGGQSRPSLAGDLLLVTSNPGTLQALDVATGKAKWTQELKGEAAGGPQVSDPVTDGKLVWFHSGAGTLGCFDLGGKQVWTKATGLSRASIHRLGNLLVVEGLFTPATKGEPAKVRVLTFDAGSGTERNQWSFDGEFDDEGMLWNAGDVVCFLTSTGAFLDVGKGTELTPPDIEMALSTREGLETNPTRGPYRMTRSGDMFFLTSQARSLGVRFWANKGSIGYAHVWESNYGSSGFGNVPGPAVATDKYLFVSHYVLEHTPHCPDPRAEINVQDVKTGRPLARLKPALNDLGAYGGLNSPPTIAGGYLFLLAGRGDNKYNQICIATADEHLQLIARNDVEPGITPPPVFAGGRMILRSPTSLYCIAVTGDAGRKYQNMVTAKTLLRVVGPEPVTAKPLEIGGLEKVSMTGDIPIGKLRESRPNEFWLGAGPFSGEIKVDPSRLQPSTGTAVDGMTFQPLTHQFAYNEPPMYLRTATLQGTGDLVPHFKTDVDPRGVSSPSASGLLYTVLDNTRDRIVVPLLKARGVTQWIGGQLVEPDKALHLRAGLYPYVLRVDPDYYKIDEVKVVVPVKVTEALAAGALTDIGWPRTWQVLGPLPPDAAPLTEEQLRVIPKQMTIGDTDFPLNEFPVKDNAVNLNALAGLSPSQKPDLANTPATVSVPDTTRAYAFATIECPSDGYLYIGAGCDWFMKWYLDGVLVTRTELVGGHGNVTTHAVATRVTKGRHVLAAEVRPGSKGWSFASVGGFSVKSGDEIPEFRIAVTEKPPVPDFRMQPCFREVPHPPTLEGWWRERATRNRARLEAIVRDMPGSEEAKQASEMLEALK